jgi:hypothetical protein
MSNVGTVTGGRLSGKTLDHPLTTFVLYRHPDPLEWNGRTKPMPIGTYTFAAGAWTYAAATVTP